MSFLKYRTITFLMCFYFYRPAIYKRQPVLQSIVLAVQQQMLLYFYFLCSYHVLNLLLPAGVLLF